MQNVKFAKVCESDIAALFGKGTQTIRAWVRAGMPRTEDGCFGLSAALRWREQQHEAERARALTPDHLTQLQLAGLLNVTRQTVTAWERAGLPRNVSGTYNLKNVCQWLRAYYSACAERKYQTRIEALRRKVRRNVRQIERFFEHEKVFFGDKKMNDLLPNGDGQDELNDEELEDKNDDFKPDPEEKVSKSARA
jgi:DNA-binding XRE family transcriptional regulator